MKKIKLSKYLLPVFMTPDNTGSWFGYYNYDPLNHDQSKLLSNRTKNDAVKIEKGMAVELGYYDMKSGDWHPIGFSDSYNWPQGAMMQWLPGKENKNKIIYNCSKNNRLISRIHDIETGEDIDINWSIYGITPDGKKSIALNMERSYWCRAYHYQSVENKEYDVRVAEDDGIFEIDLENNTRKRIISIYDIINTDKEDYFDQAQHWLEHIMINPSGTRFCFLHRFSVGDVNNYETRLFIANIDGSNLQIIEGWRQFYWSHFGWDGDEAFTIYAYKTNKHLSVLNGLSPQTSTIVKSKLQIIQKNIKALVPTQIKKYIRYILGVTNSYYQYYEISKGKFRLSQIWGKRLFNIDGHPSFTKNGDYMITDSYPDSKQYQRIIAFHKRSKQSLLLGKIYAALHLKPGSCDLHPKLCANNNFLVVDTAFDGQHHMLVFRIDWDAINNKLNN